MCPLPFYARFEVTDCERLQAGFAPRKAITLREVPEIRKSLAARLGPVKSLWCVADAFQAAVRLLNGEVSHKPGYVYGFLKPPKGVTAATVVKTSDLRAAAAKIDLDTFIPPEIDVGGVRIGPADFLFAALEALRTGSAEVVVAPREQLGSFDRIKRLESFKYSWPIHAKDLNAKMLADRLRYQLWTLRYE